MLDKLADTFGPKIAALLAIPILLVTSIPFAYISGAFSIIWTDNVALGWGVGIAVSLIFAAWAGIGVYKLANEMEEEAGAEAVSA